MESKEALGESLIAAAKRGDMSQVRELVENGADPNYCSVHSKIAGINNSRESEFPPTKTNPSSVGAISESRPLPINLVDTTLQLDSTVYVDIF